MALLFTFQQLCGFHGATRRRKSEKRYHFQPFPPHLKKHTVRLVHLFNLNLINTVLVITNEHMSFMEAYCVCAYSISDKRRLTDAHGIYYILSLIRNLLRIYFGCMFHLRIKIISFDGIINPYLVRITLLWSVSLDLFYIVSVTLQMNFKLTGYQCS